MVSIVLKLWYPLALLLLITLDMKAPSNPFGTLLILPLLALTACGARMNVTYTLNQQGTLIQSRSVGGQNCSQITLSVQDSGSMISGQGQNACFTQTIQGQTSNGQASVTVTFSAAGAGTGGYNTGGCSYQGILTFSGNSISGTLNPANSAFNVGDCAGTISLNGVRN